MNPMLAAKQLGQHLWLDNLSRGLVQNGTLARLIAEDGLSGVTSNPSIFQKAIGSDPLYGPDLERLRQQTLSAEARYEALAIPDVQAACDLFAPLYRHSAAAEGYVSLEVSPTLAHDEAGTAHAARRLWQTVQRPNLMIKIPATPAGIRAFETLLGEGMNLNVTLMFSRRHVAEVLAAATRGLQQCQARSGALQRVHAVASVFLSRVDTLIDPQLDALGDPAALALRGQAAVAMARLAYQDWLAWQQQDAVQALRQAGASAPRLLWASTSTKNPAYPDLLYVESLLGPDTVNTLPDATLAAFRDHGQSQARLGEGVEQARQVLRDLAARGLELDEVGETLQQQGLALFDDAFRSLLGSLEQPNAPQGGSF